MRDTCVIPVPHGVPPPPYNPPACVTGCTLHAPTSVPPTYPCFLPKAKRDVRRDGRPYSSTWILPASNKRRMAASISALRKPLASFSLAKAVAAELRAFAWSLTLRPSPMYRLSNNSKHLARSLLCGSPLCRTYRTSCHYAAEFAFRDLFNNFP
jgi:hypothetical protein